MTLRFSEFCEDFHLVKSMLPKRKSIIVKIVKLQRIIRIGNVESNSLEVEMLIKSNDKVELNQICMIFKPLDDSKSY